MSDERPCPKQGDFCWNELMTRDLETAKKFYSELVGWEPAASEMPGMEYTLWKVDGQEKGGVMRMPPDVPAEVPSHWISYITVDDVDAATKKVVELGGTVLHGPMDIPTVGRFCIIQDPTGATVGLFMAPSA